MFFSCSLIQRSLGEQLPDESRVSLYGSFQYAVVQKNGEISRSIKRKAAGSTDLTEAACGVPGEILERSEKKRPEGFADVGSAPPP